MNVLTKILPSAFGLIAMSFIAPAAPAAPASPAALAQQLPPVPFPPENPPTREKAILGKILFWEEQLSSDNSIACGTCHIPSAGGGDLRQGSQMEHPGADGVFGTPDDTFGSPGLVRSGPDRKFDEDALFEFHPQVTGRSSPTMINAAFADELFWDGRATSEFTDPETGAVLIVSGGALESQSAGPPLSDVEMSNSGRSWADITRKIYSVKPLAFAVALTPDITTALGSFPDYPALFANAFGDPAVTAERIAYAIATYERTLISDQTPWDLGTMTPQQDSGWNLFQSSAGCAFCHQAPLFTDNSFHNLGTRLNAEDIGREAITLDPMDRGRFKAPQLRNAGLRSQFLHTGELSNLNEVVDFYNAGGGPDNSNKSFLLFPPFLTQPEIDDLVEFLENGLLDPRVANELPPFDRPTLRSEAGPIPTTSTEVAGTGGIAPEIIATSPPGIGGRGFRIGIARALGGARAFLVLNDASTGRPVISPPTGAGPTRLGILARQPIVMLEGSGAGQGFQTYLIDIPNKPSLAGTTIEAQWFVMDPGAPGGMARSETALFTLF